jgi:hypothetical protein
MADFWACQEEERKKQLGIKSKCSNETVRETRRLAQAWWRSTKLGLGLRISIKGDFGVEGGISRVVEAGESEI